MATITISGGEFFNTANSVNYSNSSLSSFSTGSSSVNDTGAITADVTDSGSGIILDGKIYNLIENSASSTTVSGTSDADYIDNSGGNVTINGYGGSDYLTSSSRNVTIYGGNGDDTLVIGSISSGIGYTPYSSVSSNYSSYSSSSDAADTSSTSSVNNSSVYDAIGLLDGGAGDDYISNGTSGPVTILGGTGNDLIYGHPYSNNSSSKTIYKYVSGDGKDTINNYGNIDELRLKGTVSASVSGSDLVVTVDDGSITVKNGASKKVKFVKITDKVNNTYNYSGGDSVIENYNENEKVNITGAFTGITATDSSFKVNSGSGAIELDNIRGKVVSYTYANSEVVAYSYMAKSSGSVSISSSDKYEALIGADYVDNQIYAGNGGSSLWGGVGGNDTLTGGDGDDEFVYYGGSGNDVVRNSKSNDTVHIIGVSVEEITSVQIEESYVSATFADGGSLRVEGNSRVGYKFQNTTYVLNQSTKEWSLK